MTAAITNIAGRAALLAVVLLAVFAAASLRGQSPGVTFAMGTKKTPFDLRIDSHAVYNGVVQPQSTWSLKNLKPHVDRFFKLGDVKPGDRGEATISLHANKDAWVCLEFSGLKDKENGENEPEGAVDTSLDVDDGELAEGLMFFAWHDDGDNVFEAGEQPLFGPEAAATALKNKTYPVADWLHSPPLTASSTRYVGLAWCAGDMSVDAGTATISCDGQALGNEAQTDSFSIDISFEAVSKKDNPKFKCKGKNYHDDICEIPQPVTIEVNNSGAVVNNTSSSVSTGGSAGEGSAATGNATATATATNTLNFVRELFRRR